MLCFLLGHRYQFLRQVQLDPTPYCASATRIDVFYCQRCLAYQERYLNLDAGSWTATYRQDDEIAARMARRS
jgi:hypothetical protein